MDAQLGTAPKRRNGRRGIRRPAVDCPIVLSGECIVQVIRGLYDEEVRPFGRILRKCIAENLNVQDRAVDGQDLVDVCRGCAELIVEEHEKDWCALLVGESTDNLVDVYSQVDDYSEEVWRAAADFFSSIPEDDTLPGGRFMCAQELRKRKLAFLEGFSLGRLCHFVRLAEEHKGLLGTSGTGGLVPFHRSASKRVQDCAKEGKPSCEGNAYTCMDQVVADLRAILASSSGSLPMSNVKRRLKSECSMTLSETAFGKTTMLRLLQEEPKLDRLCEVIRKPNGYYVSLRRPLARRPLCLEELVRCDEADNDDISCREVFVPVTCRGGLPLEEVATASRHLVKSDQLEFDEYDEEPSELPFGLRSAPGHLLQHKSSFYLGETSPGTPMSPPFAFGLPSPSTMPSPPAVLTPAVPATPSFVVPATPTSTPQCRAVLANWVLPAGDPKSPQSPIGITRALFHDARPVATPGRRCAARGREEPSTAAFKITQHILVPKLVAVVSHS